MCNKCNQKHPNTNRRDRCMEKVCQLINVMTSYKTLASCCGHGEYPMSIVVTNGHGNPIEYFSQIEIPRRRNFYRRDKQGLFYIPELKPEAPSC